MPKLFSAFSRRLNFCESSTEIFCFHAIKCKALLVLSTEGAEGSVFSDVVNATPPGGWNSRFCKWQEGKTLSPHFMRKHGQPFLLSSAVLSETEIRRRKMPLQDAYLAAYRSTRSYRPQGGRPKA